VTAAVEYLLFFDGEFVRQSTLGRSINYVTEWRLSILERRTRMEDSIIAVASSVCLFGAAFVEANNHRDRSFASVHNEVRIPANADLASYTDS